MPFEQNQLFGMEMFDNGFVQGANFADGGNFIQGANQQQYQQGQVNNYVNHTSSVGTTQAVENVNYYDTYHHRINNYHTMNTNRYKDHYVDHNVYYNNRRNVYDGADYHTTSSYVVEQPVYATTGTTGTTSGSTGSTGSTGNCGCRPRPCYQQAQPLQTSAVATQGTGRVFPGCGCRRNVL